MPIRQDLGKQGHVWFQTSVTCNELGSLDQIVTKALGPLENDPVI